MKNISELSLQLQSIFNFIKTSAEAHEGEAVGEVQTFCWDLINMSEIGYSLSYSIWKQSQDLESGEKSETKSLSALLSIVMNHPDLPVEIYNPMLEALDAVADVSGFKEQARIEKSAKYIEQILIDYKNTQND